MSGKATSETLLPIPHDFHLACREVMLSGRGGGGGGRGWREGRGERGEGGGRGGGREGRGGEWEPLREQADFQKNNMRSPSLFLRVVKQNKKIYIDEF